MKIIKQLKLHSKNIPNTTAIDGEFLNISYKNLYKLVISIENFFSSIPNLNTIIIFGEKKSLAYPIMLACLKSRVTYVPINGETPLSRVKKIAKITKAQLIICVSKKKLKIKNLKTIHLKRFNFSKVKVSNKDNNKNNKIAYIIFTSGSTGEPKGVKISYTALEFYFCWLKKKMKVYKKNCSQISEISFDLSVADIYGTILSGGTICAVENNFYKSFPGKFIFDKQINYTVMVPSVIDLIKRGNNLNKESLNSLTDIFFCGEPLKKRHLDLIFKANKNIKIINTYGPTEFTVSCSEINLSENNYKKFFKKYISIGKPIKGVSFKILNDKNKKIKLNQGVLLLNGSQIFSGYLSETKIDNNILDYNNKKYYNTGDIVKKVNENYYFIKRNDRQIKKNGYRIELDEIDKLIESKINPEFCKAFFKNSKIILVLKTSKSINIVNKILKDFLPEYMIPNKIKFLKKIPLNKNYKIDFGKIFKSLDRK